MISQWVALEHSAQSDQSGRQSDLVLPSQCGENVFWRSQLLQAANFVHMRTPHMTLDELSKIGRQHGKTHCHKKLSQIT